MLRNPPDPSKMGTLDETILRPSGKRARFGWRWGLCCLYFLLLTGITYLTVFGISGLHLSNPETLERIFTWVGIFPLLPGLTYVLLFFRRQEGWVAATVIVAAMIVLSALGLIAQFIPSIEPYDTYRTSRIITGTSSLSLACGTLYLLSHGTLRAGFRIPQSWIRRCITLGGLIGTGLGIWGLFLVGG